MSGEALNLIKGLPLSDVNYPIGLKTLFDRFDNKRILATHHFNQLQNASRLTSENFSELRHLLNSYIVNVAALEALSCL